VLTWLLEYLWRLPHVNSKIVQYDNIQLITPDRRPELVEDLKRRLGLEIFRVEVGKVDFLRDSARVVVYYKSTDSRNINMADGFENYVTDDGDDD